MVSRFNTNLFPSSHINIHLKILLNVMKRIYNNLDEFLAYKNKHDQWKRLVNGISNCFKKQQRDLILNIAYSFDPKSYNVHSMLNDCCEHDKNLIRRVGQCFKYKNLSVLKSRRILVRKKFDDKGI